MIISLKLLPDCFETFESKIGEGKANSIKFANLLILFVSNPQKTYLKIKKRIYFFPFAGMQHDWQSAQLAHPHDPKPHSMKTTVHQLSFQKVHQPRSCPK
jgi:hypothetical protein